MGRALQSTIANVFGGLGLQLDRTLGRGEWIEVGRRVGLNGKSILIASAAAALFLSGAVTARAEQGAGADEVRCAGINACKGQGSCASAHNQCKGQNACKGQGIVKTSAADCKAKGGTVAPEAKKQ